MKNLGNVAGIVKGYDPPLESDGVTEFDIVTGKQIGRAHV